MLKTIGFIPRRRDLTRAAFRDHYETRHAPLAVPLFPFRRYRRNHLTDPAAEPGFDCVSEFWLDSLDPLQALLEGAAGATMRADERNFMDRPANRAAIAEEVLPSPLTARGMLFAADAGGDRAALAAALRPLGAGLDLLTPFDLPIPFDVIVTLPGSIAVPLLPGGWRAGPCLAIERCETDPTMLHG